ncbi:peroxisomal ATPase PEX6 isoform X1 [Diorhabda sublineata]|uniref:peroxisomal ATPase PEX6 isoform X1 n=1 Tax=Diorhabda sublineata TaxID=1163346 RepID=UPI0024E12C91|nr:peroxisomal ATPase PEX6 isoform X1 [Diorhabda sublineata]
MSQEKIEQAKLLLTIIKFKYQKYHPYWFIFYMYVLYLRTIKRNVKYTLTPIAVEDIIKIVNVKSPLRDINNTVIVNSDNIYKSDKILKLYCDKTKSSRNIYPVPNENCDKNKLFISDTFYNNLLNQNFIGSVRLLNNINCIKVADEISISLVCSQHEISNSLLDSLLERYFRKPKLIRKYDIIEIDIKYFAEPLSLLNSSVNSVHSIFLKCNNVSYNNNYVDGCYYCVWGETAIKQSVNIQSFVPKRTTKLIKSTNKGFKTLPICPYGLQEYFDEIELAIKPFLRKSKLSLQPTFLLVGDRGCGEDIILSSLAPHFGMHHYRIENYELMANIFAQNETKLHNCFFNAKAAAPCIISMHNFENFGKNNDGQYDERLIGHFSDELKFLFENNSYPIVLFCCSNQKDISVNLKHLFLQTFEIKTSTDIQRELNLKWICEEKDEITDLDFHDLANKTHGFVFEDLKALVYHAEKTSRCSNNCKIINMESFIEAIDYMQRNYNESIGAPKVPKVLWSDVGGLNDVKQEINKIINLPLKHPEIFRKTGLKRSGILFFGPPGTGKTLIAKAVATECNICFLSVKGPELLNMYVGQSEKNIREVFKRAREASPCIIFFDELDSLAPNRGKSGDSGGVMDRVVSQLLAEMDGLNDSATIFIIGATNRPDLIDPALLRPGRFDKLLYIGPCIDEASKISVLKALTRKFKLSCDVDLSAVVKICPKNITGADFYGICSQAWLFATRRLIKRIEIGEISADFTNSEDVIVNFDDFKNAMVNVKPSISSEDMKYFEKLKLEMSLKT